MVSLLQKAWKSIHWLKLAIYFSASEICCCNLSLVAALWCGCFNFARAELRIAFWPVTLWKILTCLSPDTKTYFPSSSNNIRVIGPGNISWMVISSSPVSAKYNDNDGPQATAITSPLGDKASRGISLSWLYVPDAIRRGSSFLWSTEKNNNKFFYRIDWKCLSHSKEENRTSD